MTDKVIAFTQLDGSVTYVTPVDKTKTIEEIAASSVPAGIEYKIVKAADLPQDRYFRNAWCIKGRKVVVDMPKARDVHMKEIRKKRNEKMKVLDIETMKGLDVQAEKQVLRDLPAKIDLTTAETPVDLKAIWPNLDEKSSEFYTISSLPTEVFSL